MAKFMMFDNNFNDVQFKFSNSFSSRSSMMPRYFEKNIENIENTKNKDYYNPIYFYKDPILNEDNIQKLNFNNLFDSYTKYNRSMNVPSYYNSIYYRYKSSEKTEIFGIVRLKSNESMPRFQFAYDSDEFTKEEVTHLIHHMFYQSNT